MRPPIKYCFVLLCNFCILHAFSQDFQVRSSPFTENYGLGDQQSLKGIHCILLDREGFFWVGNQRGLYRFDGKTTASLESLVPDLKRPITNVTAIHEDEQNQIWMGAEGSIYSYDRGSMQLVHHQIDFTGVPFTALPNINGISLINATNLLVTTSEGLFRLIRKDDTATTWQVEHFQQLTLTDEELKFFEDIASSNPLTDKLEIMDSLHHTVSFHVEDSATYLITATSPKMFSSIDEINDAAWLEDGSGDTVWTKYSDFYFLPNHPSAVSLPPGKYRLHAQLKLFPYFEDVLPTYLVTVRALAISQANTFKKIVNDWNTRRSIVENQTEHLLTDSQGTTWITGGGGLTSMKLVKDTPMFQVYTPHKGRKFGQQAIHTNFIYPSVTGGLWLLGRGYSRLADIQSGSNVFARNHIMYYRYDEHRFFRIPFEGSHPIVDICEARDSSLWILQNDGMVFCIAVDPHRTGSLRYRHQFKLEGFRGFTRILCDLGNNIWIVTSQQGLIKIGHEENKINRWKFPLGTIMGGVSNRTTRQPLLFTEAGIYTYERAGRDLKGTLISDVSGTNITCILPVSWGYLAGTKMGDLFSINPTPEAIRISAFGRVQSNPRFPIAIINMVPETDSTVYVSTDQGLFLYNHFNHTISENLINPLDGVLPQVPDILEYKGQKLAIANTYSVQYGNGGYMVPITTDISQDQSLKSDFSDLRIDINAAIVTQDDQILVGSELGLHKYDPEHDTFQVLASGGFPPVYNLMQDTDGDIWAIGSKGLSLFNLQTADLLTYSQITIPPKGMFDLKPPMWQGVDGDIYFSNGEELFSFSPHRLKNQWATPHLHLDMVFSQDRSGKVQVIPVSNHNLVLEPFQKTFTIKFSTTHLSYPNQATVSYRLAGYHKDWLPTDRMEVQYINVPSGHYSFEIRVRNGRYEDQQTIRLSILPFWWQTTLAKIGYLIVFLVILWWILRQIQQRELLKNHLQLEQLEKDKIAALHQLRSRFFANISHEFRTPLTLIHGPIEDSLRVEEEAAKRSIFRKILDQTQRMLKLVDDLLDLSKLDSRVFQLNPKPGNIYDFMSAHAEAFQYMAKQKQINYQIDIPYQKLFLAFDHENLEKVLVNLLSNAFKHTPPSGEVQIFANYDQASQTFSCQIRNEGATILPEEIEHIFHQFYQAKNVASPGSGVGLALVKELVGLMNGSIQAKSNSEEGTIFSVTLPLVEIPLSETQTIPDKHSPTEPEWLSEPEDALIINSPANDLPQVLVIEDNAEVRMYIVNTLNESYQVIEATNGEDGFSQAVEHFPDMIVCDVMMPVVDGITFCKQLKNDPRTDHIPVILLTARGGIENRLEGLQVGSDDYLTKPFSSTELRLRIANLIQQRNQLKKRFTREIHLDKNDPEIKSADQRFLERAVAIVEEHLNDASFDIHTFSQCMHLSRTHLHKKLKAITGQSPSEFSRNLRLQHAAALLEKHYDQVSQIAFQTGFNNLSYFTKMFKAKYGIPPSKYRGKVSS